MFNELSRFVNHLINFSVPYDQANELVVFCCEQFQLEKSKAHILLTELRSNQKNTSKMFTERETRIWSLQKRSNRLLHLGYSDQTLIVGLLLKYIDSDQTLRAILCCSKDFNEILKPVVYK